MKRLFLIPVTLFLLCSCISSKKDNPLIDSDNQLTEFMGQIFMNKFINKAGRPDPDAYDYYFRHYGKNYFIKLSECSYNGNITSWIGPIVRVKGEIRSGLWDTDNPKAQSRSGEYFVFSHIETIEKPLGITLYDGNNNRYILSSSQLKFDPVLVIESSSGFYSGGVEKNIPISPEDYYDLFIRLLDIYDTGQYALLERVKGSFMILVEYHSDKENVVESYIIEDHEEMNVVKSFIDSYFDR
jgi:hypothetical protein